MTEFISHSYLHVLRVSNKIDILKSILYNELIKRKEIKQMNDYLTDYEILLTAIEIISDYTEKVGDDNPCGYTYVHTYQNLIDDIKEFMEEVGLNEETTK